MFAAICWFNSVRLVLRMTDIILKFIKVLDQFLADFSRLFDLLHQGCDVRRFGHLWGWRWTVFSIPDLSRSLRFCVWRLPQRGTM